VVARARGNSTPETDLEIAKELERRISGITDIESAYTVAGAGATQGGSEGNDELPVDTVAQVFTELVPFQQRDHSVSEIIDQLRDATDDIPGVYTEVITASQGPPVGKDIAIELSGDNSDDITDALEIVRTKLASTEGIFEIGDTLPVPGVDWELQVDRVEAGRLGLDISRIGSAIQFVTEGALVSKFRPSDSDEEVDIRIRYPDSYRDLKVLDNLRILTPSGAIPLSSVVNRVPKPRQDTIKRRNQKLVYEINGNSMEGFATNAQVAELKEWLGENDVLPEGVGYRFLGQAEENASAGQFFQGAGLAVMFMMGVILLLQFNSFYHVALTLMSVMLSVFGVLLGLTFYSYISMILTLTGVIALAGIIVNNNIVLIDTYQRLLKNGYEPEDAALRTAAQRIRPVLLTTITTVIGLMPLVLGWQADIFSGTFSTKGTGTSDIWAPISYVLVCGLTFATTMTLIVTPVLLAAPTIWKKQLGIYKKKSPEPAVAAATP